MPWLQSLKYALVALLILLAGLWHWYDKKEALNAYKAEQEAKAHAMEQKLNYDAWNIRATKDAKITELNTKLSSALSLLRNRPQRDNPAAAGEACTGTKLFREDAEFLTREAARADQLIIERDYYYERYEAARRELAGQKSDAGRHESSNDN